MKLSFAFGVCAAFSSHAQTAEEIKNSPDWTRAVVVTDGAAVYSRPDFDAPVVDYLSVKSPLHVSKRATPGHGGLGLFHKVRYKSKAGFMADTDIRAVKPEEVEPEPKEVRPTNPTANKTPRPKRPRSKLTAKEEDDDERGAGRQPLYFTRLGGASVGIVNFTEKFSGRKLTDHILMYGLRLTGPDTLFEGPPLDINLWFSMQKPAYYSQFAVGAKGFLLFGDILAMFPVRDAGNFLINFGAGMMWTYTNYQVQVKNSKFDSQEVRAGFEAELGAAYRIAKMYALRADVRWYWEKTQYFGYTGALQMEY